MKKKIAIVKDYLNEDLSYNNIYSWGQKYKIHGPDRLIDGHRRHKPDTVPTLKTEIAALKALSRVGKMY